MSQTLTPSDEFVNALRQHAVSFNVALKSDEIGALKTYFELVMLWNKRLHLVAPCSPSEFATRHVLESLLASRYMSDDARVIDVGSGAGLPIIPCLIARPTLKATLFESSPKKTVFLREALRRIGRNETCRVVAERFETAAPPSGDFLTCRALDRFTDLLPELLEWSSQVKTLLLFGGESVRERIAESQLPFDELLIPESERRFIFIVERAS